MGQSIVTPKGRVSFPHVFEAYGFQNQAPKFSIQLILEKGIPANEEFVTKLKAVIMATIADKWPDSEKRPLKPQLALKDGDIWLADDGSLKKDKYPEYGGAWVISAGNTRAPGVVDENIAPILDRNEFYAGCYAQISITPFAYDNVKKGVSFSLGNVRKDSDGEPFGARGTSAEQDFGPPNEGPGKAPAAEEADSIFN